MFKYVKHLEYPINITKKDLSMAKLIITQVGGFAGELGAAMRYYSQKFTMPDEKGRALLNDIANEELGHIEMVATICYQLMQNATIDEIKKAGLESYFTEHKNGIYPVDASGVPFTASVFAVTADPLTDLSEDMAAEQKARSTYERLIDLATDPDVIGPLLWLRQREVVHFARFKELYDYYEKLGY